jgi:hypothetical protein
MYEHLCPISNNFTKQLIDRPPSYLATNSSCSSALSSRALLLGEDMYDGCMHDEADSKDYLIIEA